jgi:hypothetical protein
MPIREYWNKGLPKKMLYINHRDNHRDKHLEADDFIV